MKLRVRLVLAFLLLSVVPLGAVTTYSYISNYRALQAVATREADQLADELSQRMQLVTTQLSERVEHLMDLSSQQEPVVPAVQVKRAAPPAAPAAADPELASLVLNGQAAAALGEAAMLLNTVELRGMRGPGGGRGGPPGFARDGSRGGFVGPRQRDAAPRPPSAPPTLMPPPPPVSPGDVAAARRFGPNPKSLEQYRYARGPSRGATTGSSSGNASQSVTTGRSAEARGEWVGPPTPPGLRPDPSAPMSEEEANRIRIDVGPIARDIFRQFVPEGANANELTADQRQRVASEINQRMTGINEGIKLAAAELQRKADQARRKAEADAQAATIEANITRRRSALTGNRLDVTVEQDGKVVRAANAEINLPNVLMTVFSSMPRGQGEVPFAVGKDGRVYTPTVANRATIEQLAPARLPNGASMIGEWVVVMTADPTGSGLRLGIARPVADSLSELRRAAARNAGLGLAFIGLSIMLIVPLSGRLTHNLSRLTDGVTRIAHGQYSTRVQVKTKDELGELARAFNQMASDVEAHQRAAIEQERIKRELELGRQIQHDMQPQEPLRLGLTEVQGVSVPAREVGGDFFNYFALPDGQVALLIGDVSGKGVGAALLMANIQASLRTRFALGQDLSAIADAIDRDIETNSPGQMYATLFVGILDPQTRGLRYVNAGHHPQYILRMRGGLERMSATGLPAGLLAGRGYREQHLQLERGDLIFFYTDGCPETENANEEMFGTERLESLLASSGSGGPDAVLQHVETALKQFRGTREPYDDATMMAVRVG